MRAVDSIQAIEADWRELSKMTGSAPFLAPGWVRAWLDSFGQEGLRIHTAWRSNTLVGVLPTRVHRHGTVVSPANWHTPFWAPLAVDDDAAAALARGLVDDRPHRIELRCLDPDLPRSQAFIRSLHDLGYRTLPGRHLRFSPFAQLTTDWETFSTRLSRSRRASIRRAEARLAELGDARLEVYTGGDELDERLLEGFRLESSGWKGRSGSAIDSAADTLDFYTRVAHWAADEGTLRLMFLRLDEQVIAFSFNLEHDGTVWGLRIGYDEEHRSLGPGMLLMKSGVSLGIDHGAHTIDLGGDLQTDAYKREWSDGTRRVLTATWLAPTLRGKAEHRAAVTWSSTKRRLDATLPEGTFDRIRAARTRIAARLGRH